MIIVGPSNTISAPGLVFLFIVLVAHRCVGVRLSG
nr:MAG TPA: hypothetical protein [Caudoviricetes sp.]